MNKKKNKVRRYRLNDYTAQKLGCELNKSKRYRLSKKQETQLMALAPQKIKRLIFDIETSFNIVASWRIGYNLNLGHENILKERAVITIAYKWEDDSEVKVLKWDENQCDKKMLEEFAKVLNEADESIAHNGDRFDLPWLKTRFIYHRIPCRPNYKTLDTLKKARGGFLFNSNRLDYLGQYLGVGRKLEHTGFKLWKDIVIDKSEEAMKLMCDYNIQDVLLLEDVYHVLQPYITANTHVGVHNGMAKYSCPQCGSESVRLEKNEVSSKGSITRVMSCECCNHKYNISNSAYKHYLETNFNSKL